MNDQPGCEDIIIRNLFNAGDFGWIAKMRFGQFTIHFGNEVNPACFSFDGRNLRRIGGEEYATVKKLIPAEYKGGVIVLPSVSLAEYTEEEHLWKKTIDWVEDLFEAIVNDIGLDSIPEEYRDALKMVFALAVGRFFRGVYIHADRVQFDDDSICLEMPGFDRDLLMQTAKLAILQMEPDAVLVKDYGNDKIQIVESERRRQWGYIR